MSYADLTETQKQELKQNITTINKEYKSTYNVTGETTIIPINISRYNKDVDVLEVYVNGLRLIENTDYTVTSATQITLKKVLEAGNEVHFICEKSISATTADLESFKGIKGDKGDTGATGPQGPKGDTGAQGPKGDDGEINKETFDAMLDENGIKEEFGKYLPLIGGTITGNLWLKKGFNVSYHTAGSGQAGYIKIANIKIGSTYANVPIVFEVLRRGDADVTKIMICFANANNNDPGISKFEYENRNQVGIYLTKVDAGSWDLYIQKSEGYDNITIVDIKNSLSYMSNVIITLTDVFSTSASGTKAANRYDTGWTNVTYGNGISTHSTNAMGAVRRCGKVVELNATVTNSTTWTTHSSIITIPTGFRPSRPVLLVCQGSGSNRFLLIVNASGTCQAERYSNTATMSNTVPTGSWLCLHGTWITDQ